MPGVTKEQIAKAREWDLLSYLQTYEPQELKRCGPNEYCTRTHDSLRISHGKWCWFSRGIGGRSALDYLIKVRNMGFVDAVKTLCGAIAPPVQSHPNPGVSKPFTLPEANYCVTTLVSYLQKRGVSSEIISACMKTGILYESQKHHNCVFVGKDTSGHARAASLRGTSGNFKMDVPGSDKRFSFFLPAAEKECHKLAVAESPIDALSLATMVKLSGGEWRDCHYLSLGGTAPSAMLQFLHDHPAVTHVNLCLDNDKAGQLGIQKLEQTIREDAKLSGRIKLIYPNPPPQKYGKDYNEMLIAARKIMKQHQKQNKNRENTR